MIFERPAITTRSNRYVTYVSLLKQWQRYSVSAFLLACIVCLWFFCCYAIVEKQITTHNINMAQYMQAQTQQERLEASLLKIDDQELEMQRRLLQHTNRDAHTQTLTQLITTHASKHQIQLSISYVGKPLKLDYGTKYSIQLTLQGTFNNLYAFLEKIKNTNHHICCPDFTIKALDTNMMEAYGLFTALVPHDTAHTIRHSDHYIRP